MAFNPAGATPRHEMYYDCLEAAPQGGLEPAVLRSPQLDTREQIPETEAHAAGIWLSRKCLVITVIVLVIAIAAVAGGVGGALAHKNRQGTGAVSQTSPSLSGASSIPSRTSPTKSNPTTTALPPQNTSFASDPSTNDQSTTIGVAAWLYGGQNGDQLGALLTQLNARITQVRIRDPSVPTFTVSLIQNTGIYGSAWWWYYGVTAGDLSTLLNGKRLISIDPYFDAASNLKFAVVMVPNEGAQNRAWWWYYGVDGNTVESTLQENHARLVALRAYNDGGARKFAVIMIANTGMDYRASEWYYGVSTQQIDSRIATGLRLISFSPDPFGDWDAILVNDEGEKWWYYYGLDGGQVLDTMGQNMARLIDVSRYVVNGAEQFAVVEIDNSKSS